MLDLLLAAALLFVQPVMVTGYTVDDHCEPNDPGYRWCDGLTSSGEVADPSRRIAACPRRFPFGTEVRVVGLGRYRCVDRGGKIRGHRLDILVDSEREAYSLTGWYLVVWEEA